MLTDAIEINVAVFNYNIESQILTRVLLEIEAIAHAKDEFAISDPQLILGWYVFTVSVKRELAAKIVNLLGNELLSVKDKALEKNFLGGLTARLRELGSDMHFYNFGCTCSVCSRSCC